MILSPPAIQNMSNPRSASMEAMRFCNERLRLNVMTHKDLALSIGAEPEKTSADRDIIHNSRGKGKQKLRVKSL